MILGFKILVYFTVIQSIITGVYRLCTVFQNLLRYVYLYNSLIY
jgi:hypothetical protein